MTALVELAGKRFGRLVALERLPTIPKRHTRWRCKCDCGNEITAEGVLLRNGMTKSCGCLRKEVTAARCLKHAHLVNRERTPEYTCWRNMLNRCAGKQPSSRAAYFDRGIQVCDQWKASFDAFLAHVGPRPSPAHSIDRINNDGHYEPGNVRWATDDVQRANKRRAA